MKSIILSHELQNYCKSIDTYYNAHIILYQIFFNDNFDIIEFNYYNHCDDDQTLLHILTHESFELGNIVLQSKKVFSPIQLVQSTIGVACAQAGFGLWYVNTHITRIRQVIVAHDTLDEIGEDSARSYIMNTERMQTIISDYHIRESQLRMIELVETSLHNNAIAVIEAGTGVGKSLAYLLPSVLWALRNKKQIIISTVGLALQEQLITKDIPFVEDIIGRGINVITLKGRTNYVCKRRLFDFDENEYKHETLLFDEQHNSTVSIIKKLQIWAKKAPKGDRSVLPHAVNNETWQQINASLDLCTGKFCAYFDQCFVIQARRAAQKAHITIVNHALFFADMQLRIRQADSDSLAILPKAQCVIFDEAHSIAQNATQFFSCHFSSAILMRIIQQWYRPHSKNPTGILGELYTLFAVEHAAMDEAYKDIAQETIRLSTSVAEFLDTSEYYLMPHQIKKDEMDIAIHNAETQKEMTASVYDCERIELLIAKPMKILAEALEKLLHGGARILELYGDRLEASQAAQAQFMMKSLYDMLSIMHKYIQFYDNQYYTILWIEKSKQFASEFVEYIFHETPLDIAGLMRLHVFTVYDSCICTSATLSVADSFEHWQRRIGLYEWDEKTVYKALLASPFDYKNRTLLCVPRDAPDVNSAEYTLYVARLIYKAISLSKGKGLLLFTSYSMLDEVYQLIAQHSETLGITILRQGDADRNQILRDFQQDIHSVLFATSSFWEGVDIPGDALCMVILAKLPFAVPTDPVHVARAYNIERGGGNAFMQLTLPHAAIRLKQGFGRLMRKEYDYGIIIIPDKRIIYKQYGSQLLQSLPESLQSLKPTREMLQDIAKFLDNIIDN